MSCRVSWIATLPLWLLTACATHRLNPDKVKERVQQLGLLELKGQQIHVEQISQSGDDRAIAEANLKLAFKLSKPKGKDWQIDAVRLGDRNWLELKVFLTALNEVRAQETRELLQGLVEGVRKYRAKEGKLPVAADIVKLTDVLVPDYLFSPVRYDSWNRELVVTANGSRSLQVISLGADGVRGTSDDLVGSP